MTDIIVKRANAVPYKHEDVVDILICDDSVAVSKGRAILDEEGTGGQNLEYEVAYRVGLRLGQLIKLNDSLLGEEFIAKLVGIEHKSTKDENGALILITNITVKKSTFFFSEALP